MDYGKARRLGLKHYLSSKTCPRGHPPGLRRVVQRKCMECERIKSLEYYYRKKQRAYLDAWALGAKATAVGSMGCD